MTTCQVQKCTSDFRNWHTRKRDAASERGRRMALARWSGPRNTRDISADTMRKRALYDRKGTLLVGGIDIYHSTHRSDQYDIYVRGELVATGGPRIIAEFIKTYAERNG